MLDAIARPFTLLGQEFRVTSSLGISVYPEDGQDEQTLTKNADIAMYQAKGEGRSRIRFFSEEMSTASLERLALESSLRRALEYEEFRLVYQPRRELPGGQITGVEALLRWQHPDLGLLSPRKSRRRSPSSRRSRDAASRSSSTTSGRDTRRCRRSGGCRSTA